ncbi:MAG: Fic family protein [Kineosporiaceae bacterium]
MSRAVRERHDGPYQAAVVPLIAQLEPSLPSDVVALDAEAAAEIARFDADVGSDPVPFETVMLRSESASSSMIENLTSGARAIVLAEMGSREKRNATLVVGNVAAMRAAIRLAGDLDEEAILAMHRALLQDSEPDIAGRWRGQQVWIGGDASGPHGAEFVPPHHEHVSSLMGDLVAFGRRTDLPVLTQVALAHAQFETIHPFPDGNGRTGRALVHALLRRHRLTRCVTVPVSAGLLTDTPAYFAALMAYRAGDPAPIVERFATASFLAIVNARRLVADLHAIRERWAAVIRARRGATAWRVADLLLRQPIVDAATVARELGVTSGNVPRAIAPLVEAGILVESTGHSRNKVWQAGEVLAAVDDFAARAGRRSLD